MVLDPGITVSVNGEARQLPAGSTITDLLRNLSLDRARVAVEHNRRVVPRAEHAEWRAAGLPGLAEPPARVRR